MQIKKKFLRTIAAVFITGTLMYGPAARSQSMPVVAQNQLLLPSKTWSLPLRWLGDSIHSTWEPHTALLIPVKLKNCPKQFYMQFDLGAPSSLFYKNKLLAIRSRYPAAMPLSDSAVKLENFSFKAGKMPVLAKEIAVRQFSKSGINWSSNSIEIIGTLGSDLIDGKAVVIDYPGKKLILSPAIPQKLLSQLVLHDFMYVGRRVLLPATVQDKPVMLYFDTGSSMYELLTDKKTAEALALPNSEAISSQVQSWGTYLTANSLPSNHSIGINGLSIPLHYSTYMEGISSTQVTQMMKMGIGGMTGNKLFLQYKLVLDTKNKKFGLIRSR